jgi:hypothetical protein
MYSFQLSASNASEPGQTAWMLLRVGGSTCRANATNVAIVDSRGIAITAAIDSVLLVLSYATITAFFCRRVARSERSSTFGTGSTQVRTPARLPRPMPT